MLTYKRIVAATDFSRYGDLALESAVNLARACDSELHVLHIVVPQIYQNEMPEIMIPQTLDLTSELLDVAGRHLQNWQQTISPSLNVQTHVIESASKEDMGICRFANEIRADLIVVGSHGHTGLMHLLLGSTAEQVVRHAKCPVLVAKPRVPFT